MYKRRLTCIAVMTVLMCNDSQQTPIPHTDETLEGPLVGAGETVGEHPQTEAELGQAVKREVPEGETSI